MPAKFHKSPFHSSRRGYELAVSKSKTYGAPSTSQRPYRYFTPCLRMASRVTARWGSVGSWASTSTGAVFWLRGPIRQYLSPYSETVTGTFVLITVYIPPTLLATSQAHSKRNGLRRSRFSSDI